MPDLSFISIGVGDFNFAEMSPFIWGALILAIGMLIWDTIEVGRNDAANLVNAVFGARILKRRAGVLVAGVGVVLGACLSSGVVDTARKGIFDPTLLPTIEAALSVYISVYIVDTVLLYGYSSFGMPVSTTACLVFELLGAAFAIGGSRIVYWDKAGKVVFAIVLSIFVSGVAGFFIQRMVRGAIRERGENLVTLLLHGAWSGGGMLAMLCYFMVMKGMKNVGFVKAFKSEFIGTYGATPVVLALWMIFAIIIHFLLVTFRQRAAVLLLPVLAIIGTFCMGIAFGQNDLANCAAPGLAAITLIEQRAEGVALASKVPLQSWMLLACGLLLLVGMLSARAHRVTQAAVSAGSMSNVVAVYAPNWCKRIARRITKLRSATPSLAPAPITPNTGQVRDYDPLRACVILGVSSSVIAFASGQGLPVSTTYVTFAAVVATGAADRILQRGDAELKLARTIWVIFSWFSGAIIAAVSAGLVCKLISVAGLTGMILAVLANFGIRRVVSKMGDKQQKRVDQDAEERLNPEEYSDFEG